MTPNEFDRWWSDSQMRWPSLSAWLGKCFSEQPRQVEFLRSWRAVVADVALADALEVNRLMQAGDLPWVGEYDSDKERLPQHVRKLARQLAYDRTGRHAEPEFDRKPGKETDFPAGKILRRWADLQKAGVPREEARAQVLAEIPIGKPRWEPRYSCLVCRDTGRVLVASNTAIEAMLVGTFDSCHHREGVMVCSCRPGPVVRKSHGQEHRVEQFNPTLDFEIDDHFWGEREVRRFAEWVDVQREKRSEAMLKSKANYEPAFAAFGQREFAP